MKDVLKFILSLVLSIPSSFANQVDYNHGSGAFRTGYNYEQAMRFYITKEIIKVNANGVIHQARVQGFKDTPDGKVIIFEDLGKANTISNPRKNPSSGNLGNNSNRNTGPTHGSSPTPEVNSNGVNWGDIGSTVGTGLAVYGTFASIGNTVDNARRIHKALQGNLQNSINRHTDIVRFLHESSRQMNVDNIIEINRLGKYKLSPVNSLPNEKEVFDVAGDLQKNCSKYSTLADMSADYIHAILDKNLYQVAAYANQVTSLGGSCVNVINESLNAEGIIDLRKFDKEMPLNPMSFYQFQSADTSAFTLELKRLANNYTANWYHQGAYVTNPNQGLAALTGEMYLQAADYYQSIGRSDVAAEMFSFSTAIYEIATGFSTGVLDSITDNLQTIPFLAEIAVETAQLFKQSGFKAFEIIFDKSALFLGGIPDAIKADIIKHWEILKNGSSFERAQVVGKIVTDRIVDQLTAGGNTALKMAASGGKANHITKTVKNVERIISPSEYRAFKRGQQVLDDIDLVELEMKSKRFHELADAHGLNDNARDFFAKRIAFEERILGGGQYSKNLIEKSIVDYNFLNRAIDDVIPISYTGPVWRGASKEFFNGINSKQTDLFENHIGMYLANGRYTQPGQKGLYTTIARNKREATNFIAAELNVDIKKIDNYFISHKKVKLDVVLDLTNLNVRKSLGVKEIGSLRSNEYDITHMIGHIAERKGYQGIVAPSAPLDGGNNLVIFQK